MGVHPYKPPQELFKKFKPIAEQLSKQLGKTVAFEVAKSYDDAVAKLESGDFDFAFLGPVLYIKARERAGVQPVAQVMDKGRPTFHGVIVVKAGSTIKSVKEMKGRSFAFGEKGSTLTHVVPLSLLMENGIHLSDLSKHRFVGTHDNVAMNIIRGEFDMACLQPDVAEKYAGQGLSVIGRSPELPEHVFVASRKIDAKTLQKTQAALVGMDISLAKGIKESITGMTKFTDKDFDVLRAIMKRVDKELEK